MITLIVISSHWTALEQNEFNVITPQLLVEGIIQSAVLNIKELQQRAEDGGSIFGYDRELGSIWQNPVTCNVCHAYMGFVNIIASNNYIRTIGEDLISYGCGFYMNETVCSGAVHQMGDVLMPQLTEFLLTGDYSCSRLLGFWSTPSWTTQNPENYIRRLIQNKPQKIKNNDFIDNLYKQINEDKKERETVKILHMSDLHIDLNYIIRYIKYDFNQLV